ncbi:hypothetical protein RchiOBHm_Chr7g0196851 [Rosa chinensis]|uniref:Uncharacterized protein n=1 Tax=Rosa chinensis TaxID=74649 RepID=A0A2P6P6R2_ROSCH|nr:hypothetical protein RchiOBHm_Chr7g0196851 [Rosa chinensis]
MRGVAALSPVKNRFKQIHPIKGSWGTVVTSTSNKQGNSNYGEAGLVTKEKTDPIVVFSRPPPLPPVIGPLLVLSLLEASWSRNNDDD